MILYLRADGLLLTWYRSVIAKPLSNLKFAGRHTKLTQSRGQTDSF
jgi:hypothetical protein